MRKILTIPTLSASLLLQGTLACAESDVGAFQSTVTIQGNIGQSSSGTNNRQDLNVGSASNSRTRSFNANVSTGAIRQSAQGSGIQQRINVGSMQNSQASTFSATVQTRSIEQVATKSGQRQELDIGSVTNSTINGAANTSVHIGQDIRQIGSGEIVLGSVKNSNIGNFNQNLTVQGKLIGNNIRMGSVIGQERYGNDGKQAQIEEVEQSYSDTIGATTLQANIRTPSSFAPSPPRPPNTDLLLTGKGSVLRSDPELVAPTVKNKLHIETTGKGATLTGNPEYTAPTIENTPLANSLETLTSFFLDKESEINASALSFSLYNAYLELSSLDVVIKHLHFKTKDRQALLGLIEFAINKSMQNPSIIKSLREGGIGLSIDLIVAAFSDALKENIGIEKEKQGSISREMLRSFGDYTVDIAASIVKNTLISSYQSKGNPSLFYFLFSTGFVVDMGGMAGNKVWKLFEAASELNQAESELDYSRLNRAEVYYNMLNKANFLNNQIELILQKKNTFSSEEQALLNHQVSILETKEKHMRKNALTGLDDMYISIAKEEGMNVRDVTRIVDIAIKLKQLHEQGVSMELFELDKNKRIVPTKINDLLDFAIQGPSGELKKNELMARMVKIYLPKAPLAMRSRLTF